MNVVSPWTVYRKTSEAIEREFSALWQQCYPRRYEEPGRAQYDSPKAVARGMIDGLLSFHMANQVGQTEQNEALWASTMVKYGVPTYYLSHDIAVALTQTTPSEVLDCMGIKLPFDAAAFMLPLDVFTHGEYGPVAFIAYARNFSGTSVNCPHPVPAKKWNLNIVTSSFTVFLRTVAGNMLHWTYDQSIRLIDLKNDEELEELQRKYSHSSSIRTPESQEFTPDDIAAMTKAIKFIFNVILLMTHKPELIEPAQMLKRVTKGPGKPIEYWSPHVIGRHYKLRYEHHEGAGTHASPRGHWVSGFWREQHYGPKHSLSKTLWIEPYWRGGKID
jgi:hypothetical protein